MPKKTTKSGLSDSHKAAMAEGRKNAQAVRQYLEALKLANAPKGRGRRATPDSLRERLERVQEQLGEGDVSPLAEVQLIQERIDLEEQLERLEQAEAVDPEEYEPGFVDAASAYSEAKGISYTAWRQAGVPAATLRKAGISRSS